MKGKIWSVIALGLAFSFIFAVGRAPAAEPVKIACHGEFTGRSSPYGMGNLLAVRFELKKKNEAGGIKSLGGAKIEMIEEDNASEPKNSVASHERLASNKEILAILGPSVTPQAMPVEPIAGKYRIPTIFFTTTTDQVFEHGNKYVFTTATLASRMSEIYVRFVLEMQKKYHINLNRITLAYPDNEYGLNISNGFKEGMKKAGLAKNIVLDQSYDASTKNLEPLVLKLKAAKPDFHVQVGYFADGKCFHDASFTLAFHPLQVGGSSSYNHPDLWKALGEKIGEATLGNRKTFFQDSMSFDMPNPSRDAWIKSFSAENPKAPIDYNLFYGAFASRMLFDALEAAGKRDREAITEALHKMYMQKDDPRDLLGYVETPGPVWLPNGKSNVWGVIQQWEKKGGKWEKITVYHPTIGMVKVPQMFK